MQVDLNIYIPSWDLSSLRPEDLANPEKIKDHLSFSRYKPDGIVVGQVSIEFGIVPKDDIIGNAVLMLRAKQAEIRKEAEQKCQALERAEQQLLALPMVTK